MRGNRRAVSGLALFVVLFLCALGAVLPKSQQSVMPLAPPQAVNTPQAISSGQTEPTQAPLAALPTAPPSAAAFAPQADTLLAPTTSEYYYVPETSHSVSAFAPVFSQYGGVFGVGLPLTEPFIESRPDGKAYWVQYFEKAVTEYHPELAGSNSYQLTALGADALAQKYPSGVSSAKPLPGKSSQTFPETKHTVRGAFLTRWNQGGGLARFGYPVAESFEEVSPADSKTYLVQYFERAEMQYHPGEKAPQDVQFVPLGAQRLARLYPNGAPSNASQAIPSPTVNAPATAEARQAIAQKTQTAKDNAQATLTTAHANATATALARVEAQQAQQQTQQSQQTAPGPFIPYAGNGLGPTQCADGMWSHSSGRGTCSHHGGIKH